MRLLIGYDGSECATASLTDLRHAGLPADVEAVVISVADVWSVPEGAQPEPVAAAWLAKAVELARAEVRRAVERMRAEANSAAERVRKEFPKWTVRAEAVGDSPAWAILKRAGEWRPDLIVLGSQGRSALGRLFLGSVSQKVLTAADCSVRISRSRTRTEQGGSRLLVGVDGSVHAARAVSAIKSRSWPRGTVVRVVSALDAYLSTAVLSPDERIARWFANSDDAASWVHTMNSAAAKELADAGLDAEAIVKPGDPKQVLVAEAEAWNADCVFVGAQGLSAVQRVVLGSVSAAVAARARCTVEVVRAVG
jgi:nucleotide-binding universal stress UspA family protein